MLRKTFLASALMLAVSAPNALAQNWREKYKEVNFGVIPVETQTQTSSTMDGFAAYASKKLGVPVKIFTAMEISFGGDILAVASIIVIVSLVLMLILDRLVGLERLFATKH
ncbi:MAG: hypothetical protein J0H89_11490 [Rhizobiales bacterium]|nr:hypothetical protein [Hyphomicrobiales bacterium]